MVNIRNICPELMVKARDELNEVESRIPDDISQIRDWIEKQPHLTARTDDQFLVSFLRGCKYSLEKTKSKIDSYYTIRSLSPQLFLNKQIDETAIRLIRLGPFLPLLEPMGVDGPRIVFIRYAHLNFDGYVIEDLFKMQLRILDIQLFEDDNVIIGGLLCLMDMSSMSLTTMLKFDMVTLKKILFFSEKATPRRTKGIHMINIPKEALFFINALQNVVPKKYEKQFVFHSSMESLYEYVPKKYLPKEYGGENESLINTTKYWENMFVRYKDFFEEDVNYCVNEKLRVGDKITLESIFGLEGSFRKLEVD